MINRKESIVNKLHTIINEGMVNFSSEEIAIDKNTAVGLMINFIKNTSTRSSMEKALKSIDFFSNYVLEDGYTLNTIEGAFKEMEGGEIKEILNLMSKKTLIESRISHIDEQLSEISHGEVNSEIIKGYVYTALGHVMYKEYSDAQQDLGVEDLSDKSKKLVNKEIYSFLKQAGNLVNGMQPFRIGEDLWNTRAGYGEGFRGRGLDDIGEKLANIAYSMGDVNAFWDDYNHELNIDSDNE